MARVHKYLVVLDQRSISRRIYRCEVADVVAVSFQPLDHRELCAEEPRCGFVVIVASQEGSVVADLIGTAVQSKYSGIVAVKAAFAVVVIGLPGLIRSLIENGRMAGIIADNKDDVAFAAGIGTNQMRNINAGDRGCRHGPGCGNPPVAAVRQP